MFSFVLILMYTSLIIYWTGLFSSNYCDLIDCVESFEWTKYAPAEKAVNKPSLIRELMVNSFSYLLSNILKYRDQ